MPCGHWWYGDNHVNYMLVTWLYAIQLSTTLIWEIPKINSTHSAAYKEENSICKIWINSTQTHNTNNYSVLNIKNKPHNIQYSKILCKVRQVSRFWHKDISFSSAPTQPIWGQLAGSVYHTGPIEADPAEFTYKSSHLTALVH